MNRRNALLLVLFAAAVRALALWDDADSLLYTVGGLDAPQYLEMARGFAAGEWPDAKPFFWAPGYSVFLGLLTQISASVTWLKAVQVALGAISCGLVGVLTARLFESTRVTWLAMLVAALYGPLVYYDLQISPASLDVFLYVLLLVLLIEARSRERVWLWLAAGVVAAASAVTRGAVLLLAPCVVVWMLWPPPRIEGRVLRAHATRLVVWLAPIAIVLALVVRHNVEGDRAWGSKATRAASSASEAHASGGLMLSYNLGINFLLGNVPELYAINRVEHPLCFLEYKALVFEPVFHGASKPSAQSSYLVDKALASIGAHPREWLQLMGTKLLELVHGSEISRDTSIEASGVDNRVLAALMWKHGIAFPSGLVIPLALLGLVFAPKRSRAHVLVLLALATQAVFILAFFVTTRYRLALWTAAIPYAAYALSAAFDALRRWQMRRHLVTAALAALALAVSNHGLTPTPVTHVAFEHVHLGAVLDKQGKRDEAAHQWETALALAPGDPQAHFQLASHAGKRGDTQAAAAHYEAGLQTAPETFAARLEYANLLLRQARRREATDELRRVLAQGPGPGIRGMVCMIALRAKLDLRPDCGRSP